MSTDKIPTGPSVTITHPKSVSSFFQANCHKLLNVLCRPPPSQQISSAPTLLRKHKSLGMNFLNFLPFHLHTDLPSYMSLSCPRLSQRNKCPYSLPSQVPILSTLALRTSATLPFLEPSSISYSLFYI